jgi:hypothetical protein
MALGVQRAPPMRSALGEVKAIRSMRLRVPDGASPEVADLAGEALEKLVAVMREQVDYTQASHVLKAATRIREETCGPLAQKVEHTGKDGAPLSIVIDLGEPRDGE